jgi:hypothetical protein
MAHQTSGVALIPRVYLSNLNNDIGEEITEYVAGGSVTFDSGRLIPMSLKLDLHEHDEQIIRPFLDYLAVFATVEYDNGDVVTSQMGLFNTMPPSKTYTKQQHVAAVNGNDVTWRLSMDVFDTGYSVAAGTNFVTAITTILTSAGITRSAIAATTMTTPIAFSWKAGTPKIAVVNDLLAAMGYYPIYAAKDGTLTSQPYISANDLQVATTYDTTTEENMVKVIRSVQMDPQFDKVVNKVVVIRQGPNQSTISLTRRNMNRNSPTSIPNLGVTIAKVINDSKVVDTASARRLAIRTLEEGSYVYERWKITTTPDVERNPYEAYHLNLVNDAGVTLVDNKLFCSEWTLDFNGRVMEHTLARVDNGPDEDES